MGVRGSPRYSFILSAPHGVMWRGKVDITESTLYSNNITPWKNRTLLPVSIQLDVSDSECHVPCKTTVEMHELLGKKRGRKRVSFPPPQFRHRGVL